MARAGRGGPDFACSPVGMESPSDRALGLCRMNPRNYIVETTQSETTPAGPRIMLRRFLVSAALSLAFLASDSASVSAAGNCRASAPLVAVDLDLAEPAVDNTLPQREIQAKSPGYHAGRSVGLYWAQVEAKLATHMRIGPALPREPACVSITAVDVHLWMPIRRIYVARELQPGGCTYSAVLAHERKHQATDDRVLQDNESRIRQAVERAAADAGGRLALPADRERAQADLTKAVQAAFNRVFDGLMSERSVLQARVDAGLEYQRVTVSCPDWGELGR